MIDYIITDKKLIFKLGEQEFFVNLKKLRNSCPCAKCSGESDVFGNLYKLNLNESLVLASFKINTIKLVGNYAIRVFWQDNHSQGLYTFNFLKTLSE